MAPNAPQARNGHAACVVNNRMFIFGGFTDGAVTNDVAIFDTGSPPARLHTHATDVTCLIIIIIKRVANNGWISVEAKGTLPPARYGHSWTAIGSKLYMFGGSADGVWFNDLFVFDAGTARLPLSRV